MISKPAVGGGCLAAESGVALSSGASRGRRLLGTLDLVPNRPHLFGVLLEAPLPRARCPATAWRPRGSCGYPPSRRPRRKAVPVDPARAVLGIYLEESGEGLIGQRDRFGVIRVDLAHVPVGVDAAHLVQEPGVVRELRVARSRCTDATIARRHENPRVAELRPTFRSGGERSDPLENAVEHAEHGRRLLPVRQSDHDPLGIRPGGSGGSGSTVHGDRRRPSPRDGREERRAVDLPLFALLEPVERNCRRSVSARSGSFGSFGLFASPPMLRPMIQKSARSAADARGLRRSGSPCRRRSATSAPAPARAPAGLEVGHGDPGGDPVLAEFQVPSSGRVPRARTRRAPVPGTSRPACHRTAGTSGSLAIAPSSWARSRPSPWRARAVRVEPGPRRTVAWPGSRAFAPFWLTRTTRGTSPASAGRTARGHEGQEARWRCQLLS